MVIAVPLSNASFRITFRCPFLRELFFRRSAAGFVDAASYPGLTPLGYIFSPFRG